MPRHRASTVRLLAPSSSPSTHCCLLQHVPRQMPGRAGGPLQATEQGWRPLFHIACAGRAAGISSPAGSGHIPSRVSMLESVCPSVMFAWPLITARRSFSWRQQDVSCVTEENGGPEGPSTLSQVVWAGRWEVLSQAGGTTITLSPADLALWRRDAPGFLPSTCLPTAATGSAASQRLLQTSKLL